MNEVREKAKKSANVAINAPVMFTYPSALVLASGLVKAGLWPIIAALVVSFAVYALDWASSEGDWDGNIALRRLVYVGVNTIILFLVVIKAVSLKSLGLA